MTDLSPLETIPPNQLIRASAGTGKTFALSSRYLQLLLAGQTVDSILATTFTRKAAGEIFDRILKRLAFGAESDAAAAILCKDLGRELVSPTVLRELLHGLVAQLPQVRVSTLDAFFTKQAQAYALELGLPAGWRMLDDPELHGLRSRAIDGLLRQMDREASIELLQMLRQGDVVRSVADDLQETAKAYHDKHQEAQAPRWDWMPAPPPINDAAEDRQIDAAIDGLAEQVDAARAYNGHHGNGLVGYLTAARVGDLDKMISSKFAICAETGDPYQRKPVQEELRAGLSTLRQIAIRCRLEQIRRQSIATGRLLDQFGLRYDDEKRQVRGLEFADVTRALGRASFGKRRGYRLDGEIRHLLLDEFQDTSTSQWDVLRPLAEQAVAVDRGSVFCVGDIKQAIYGWRGGVAAIFEAFAKVDPGMSQTEQDQSYRSSMVVLDTVNAVFGNLAQCPLPSFIGDEAIGKWSDQFEPHKAAKTLTGYACVAVHPDFGEQDDDDDGPESTATEQRRRWVADYIAREHTRRPDATIGVLTRGRKELAALAAYLRATPGLEQAVSEEGGEPISDSAAVQVLCSLLQLAVHPGDTKARFAVATSPLAGRAGLTRTEDAAATASLSMRLRTELAETSLAAFLRDWSEPLVPLCGRRDLVRVRQLVDLAREQEAAGETGVDEFVARVFETKRAKSSDAPIRVMTIHGSKGLEFDVAILAELGKPLARPDKGGCAVWRACPTDRPSRMLRWVSKQVQAAFPPEVAEVYRQSSELEVLEGICLFYVAATRAKRAIHFLVSQEKPKSVNDRLRGDSIPRPVDLLRGQLHEGKPFDSDGVAWDEGDADWATDSEGVALPAIDAEPVAIRLATKPGSRDRGRLSPSQVLAARDGARNYEVDANAQRLPELLHRTPPGMATARGSLLHRWLEEVFWSSDLDRLTDGRLTELANFLDGPPQLTPNAIEDFRRVTACDAVADVLDPDRYRFPFGSIDLGSAIVRTEQRFAVPPLAEFDDGRGTITVGSIDRLVVQTEDMRPTAAEVIDWKTDRVRTTPQLADLGEHYALQMRLYRLAVAHLLAIPVDRVAVRLVFLSAGQSLALPIDRPATASRQSTLFD